MDWDIWRLVWKDWGTLHEISTEWSVLDVAICNKLQDNIEDAEHKARQQK